jgi:hypothetical protein
MARLSDADVDHLIASLGEPAAASTQARAAQPTSPNATSGQTADAAQRLRQLSADGSLGPLLTQRLAVYLNRPLRCTSGDPTPLGGEIASYTASADGVRFWVRLESLLVSSVADAAIGGEGDAPKVGYGPKVARLATGAALEIIRVIASTLHLPEPPAAQLERELPCEPSAQAGGRLSLTTRDYGWQAGLVGIVAPMSVSTPTPLTADISTDSASPPPARAARRAPDLATALECARSRLEEMTHDRVTFGAAQRVPVAAPRLPPGWLRLSLRARAGGAIILAVDRETAAALVNCVLQADIVNAERTGALMRSGAEVLVQNTLLCFAEALAEGIDDPHHMVPLTDEAILASFPHESIEHTFTCGARCGVLRWLVPDRLLSERPADLAQETKS